MQYSSHILRLSGVGLALAAAIAISAPASAAQLTPTEQANKQVVIDFYAALDKADADGNMAEVIPAIADKYLDPTYTQHSESWKNLPGTGSDRDKLIRVFQSRTGGLPKSGPGQAGPPRPRPQRTETLMADGDLVMFLRANTLTDPATGKVTESGIFNMFRVKNGKLVDHWDVSPAMAGAPPGTPVGPSASGPPGPAPGR